MPYYLLALRSLTYAQRAQEALNRAGIPSSLLRTPASVSPKGCSHSLRVASGALAAAVGRLRDEGLHTEKVFATTDGAVFSEVSP